MKQNHSKILILLYLGVLKTLINFIVKRLRRSLIYLGGLFSYVLIYFYKGKIWDAYKALTTIFVTEYNLYDKDNCYKVNFICQYRRYYGTM